jgi:cyclopropane-fatty-acyl-phospholipid synthase
VTAATPPAIEALLAQLRARGASLEVALRGADPIRIGAGAPACRVWLGSERAVRALAHRDAAELAEAYLDEEIEIAGSWREALRILEAVDLEPGLLQRIAFRARLLMPRRAWNRASIGAHYDRDPEFFLPWFERWRSYSHGLFETPHDDPAEAQARKLEAAFRALRLEPGMRVLDVGAGWGSFFEYAGLRGVRVHGITLSEQQRAFVADLAAARSLPCTVERVDFFDLPEGPPFDGAVFMGSLEHLIDYPRVARFLARRLAPGARVWADFCAQRERFQVGAFLARHIWPGSAAYVNVPKLADALLRAGLSVRLLEDDTESYGHTVRHWADALEREAGKLAPRFGTRAVRAFVLYLRASQVFFETGRTQAYHLVAEQAGTR